MAQKTEYPEIKERFICYYKKRTGKTFRYYARTHCSGLGFIDSPEELARHLREYLRKYEKPGTIVDRFNSKKPSYPVPLQDLGDFSANALKLNRKEEKRFLESLLSSD